MKTDDSQDPVVLIQQLKGITLFNSHKMPPFGECKVLPYDTQQTAAKFDPSGSLFMSVMNTFPSDVHHWPHIKITRVWDMSLI